MVEYSNKNGGGRWFFKLLSAIKGFQSRQDDVDDRQYGTDVRVYFQKDGEIPKAYIVDKEGQEQKVRINTQIYNYVMEMMEEPGQEDDDVGVFKLDGSELVDERVKVEVYSKDQQNGLIDMVRLDKQNSKCFYQSYLEE